MANEVKKHKFLCPGDSCTSGCISKCVLETELPDNFTFTNDPTEKLPLCPRHVKRAQLKRGG